MHWRLPIGKDRVVGGRRGKPFWHAIAEAGFQVSIVRVPVTYPPERFAGTLLASMGIPDLHGAQGAYYYWTTDPNRVGAGRGGDAVLVQFEDKKSCAQLRPLADPFRADSRPSRVDVRLELGDDELAVSIGGESLRLQAGEWSDWIKVTYKFSLFAKATGWVRLYLHSLHPHLKSLLLPSQHRSGCIASHCQRVSVRLGGPIQLSCPLGQCSRRQLRPLRTFHSVSLSRGLGDSGGILTMKPYLSIVLVTASVGLTCQAMAAEVDMSQVTCKEVGALPAAKTLGVAMWVNGYVHGKAGNPKVDGDKAHANAEKLADYCKKNPDATVAAALEALAK